MHRSRLSTVLIDCSVDRFDESAAFWSDALGREVMPLDERYRTLKGRVGGAGGVVVGLQRVPEGEPEVHLDIETDDVEAEVARLGKLGARVKRRIRNHVIMEAPSGHAFCVVPVHRGDFDAQAREWEQEHVAVLREIGCKTLVSADGRQIALARAERIEVVDIRSGR